MINIIAYGKRLQLLMNSEWSEFQTWVLGKNKHGREKNERNRMKVDWVQEEKQWLLYEKLLEYKLFPKKNQ